MPSTKAARTQGGGHLVQPRRLASQLRLRLDSRRALAAAGILLLHLVFLFILVPRLKSTWPYLSIDSFADFYAAMAGNIASGEGFRVFAETTPTMTRTPGYPLLLAGLFKLFGESFAVVKVVNLLLVFASAGIIRGLARRLAVRLPARQAALAADLAPVLFLLHPMVLLAETRGGIEIFFGFWVALAAWLFVRARESGRTRNHFWAGLAFGVGALVKSTPLLFPLFWAGALLPRVRSWARLRARAAVLAALIVGLLLPLAPWVARNYALTGRFVPTMTVVGMSATQGLQIGRNADLRHPFSAANNIGRGMNQGARESVRLARERGLDFKGRYFLFFRSPQDELEFNAFLTRRVADIYRRSPGLAIKCFAVNFLGFWFGGVTVGVSAANAAVGIPFLILALAGALRFHRRRAGAPGGGPILLVTILLVLCFLAVHVPILGVARHSVPLIPVLTPWAATGVASLAIRWRRAQPASA